MSDTSVAARQRRGIFASEARAAEVPSQYTEASLQRHKQQGLELAVRARWITMGVIAVFLVFMNPQFEVLFYEGVLALLAINGWFIQRYGRVGQSRIELLLIFMDLAIMTIGMLVPNPLSDSEMPLAMQFRFGYFQYFFVILAAGTLAYSWRTVIAIGVWTVAMNTVGLIFAWWFYTPVEGLSEAAWAAFGNFPKVAALMDPNDPMIWFRVQDMIIFLIVAVTLGFSARRFNALLLTNAGLERERANLSRYFSPNVVDQLSQNDEPLKQVRKEQIAILFIDIVGFTKYASGRDPYAVIELLRGFHARMETEVFRHRGTLDKYLGDGLMATFGTPVPGEKVATDALACARSMVRVLEKWNLERRRAGEPEIRAGIGIHYGPVVLGDIGANRLEFAVIGNAVNVAAKLETLTRDFEAQIVMSNDLREQSLREGSSGLDLLAGFVIRPDQVVRGVETKMDIWTL